MVYLVQVSLPASILYASNLLSHFILHGNFPSHNDHRLSFSTCLLIFCTCVVYFFTCSMSLCVFHMCTMVQHLVCFPCFCALPTFFSCNQRCQCCSLHLHYRNGRVPELCSQALTRDAPAYNARPHVVSVLLHLRTYVTI